MPILLILLMIAFRLGLLLLAAGVMTLSVPQVLADPNHFTGWFGILVALGVALTPAKIGR